MVSLLKKIRKRTFKNSNDIFSYPFRYISTMITSLLVNTPITPLQITWGHLFIAISAAVLFSIGNYSLTILAALLFVLSYILDMVDGELARYRETRSEVSVWLDHVSDYISLFFVLAGIAIGEFRNTGNATTLILGLISCVLIGSAGVVNISKRVSNKIKQVKAMNLPFKFKWSKKLHLGIFTVSFIILTLGPLLKQINIMFFVFIIITFLAFIKAFIHRIKLIKLEFNE